MLQPAKDSTRADAYRIVKAFAALDEADVEARVELLELGARHVAEHAPRGEAVLIARLRRKWGQAGSDR